MELSSHVPFDFPSYERKSPSMLDSISTWSDDFCCGPRFIYGEETSPIHVEYRVKVLFTVKNICKS